MTEGWIRTKPADAATWLVNSYLNKLNIAVEVNLDAVDDENIDVLPLVQQQHGSQVADSLIYT